MKESKITVMPDVRIMPLEVLIAYLVVNALLSAANFILNSLLITVLYKLKKLKATSFKFIFLLSISDIFIGILHTVLPIASITIADNKRFETFKLIEQALIFFFQIFSISMTVSITLDRYIRMKYPLRYDFIMTNKKALLLVLLGLSTSIGFVTAFTLATIADSIFICYVVWMTTGYILFIAVIILYVCTYRYIKKQLSIVYMHGEVTIHIRNDLGQEYRKAVLIVVLTQTILFLPASVLAFSYTYRLFNNESPSVAVKVALNWAYTLLYTNSSFNALIFIVCNRKTRTQARQCFGLTSRNVSRDG